MGKIHKLASNMTKECSSRQKQTYISYFYQNYDKNSTLKEKLCMKHMISIKKTLLVKARELAGNKSHFSWKDKPLICSNMYK